MEPIVIVGGGASGLLTAAFLSHMCGPGTLGLVAFAHHMDTHLFGRPQRELEQYFPDKSMSLELQRHHKRFPATGPASPRSSRLTRERSCSRPSINSSG